MDGITVSFREIYSRASAIRRRIDNNVISRIDTDYTQ